MEQPKVIKFSNGELVIATILVAEQGGYILQNPIAVVPYPMMQGDMVGETFLLKPWIGITEEKTFLVPRTQDIITICSLRQNLLEQYNKYISNDFKQESAHEEDLDVDLETIRAGFLRDKNLLN